MSSKNLLPPQILEHVVETFRVLGDLSRLEILQALMEEPRTVSQVVELTGKGQANVSKHLGILAAAGLVSRTKSGTAAIYAISDPLVHKLCDMVCSSVRGRLEREVKAGREALKKG
jgi:DNA-binding transcriptional ArsR family regulator